MASIELSQQQAKSADSSHREFPVNLMGSADGREVLVEGYKQLIQLNARYIQNGYPSLYSELRPPDDKTLTVLRDLDLIWMQHLDVAKSQYSQSSLPCSRYISELANRFTKFLSMHWNGLRMGFTLVELYAKDTHRRDKGWFYR